MPAPPDPIDALLEQWRRERPDLDPSPMGLVGRLLRVPPERLYGLVE